MEEVIKSIIEKKELEKRALNAFPEHITRRELILELTKSADYAIERMKEAGSIQTGETINSTWIKIK